MNETGKMYDNYLLEEAKKNIKKQVEAGEYRRKNQNTFGVPVERNFVIPGSQALGISTSIPNFTSNNTYNSTMNEYKKNNEAIKVELPTNLNEAINNYKKSQETKSLNNKVIDDSKKVVKPDITIINNQKYNPSFVINEATDGEKIKNMFDTQMRNYKEQEEQKIRAQIGMNYGI